MMSWLMAADAPPAEGPLGGSGSLIFMLGAMFLIMYLLVFRPQRKREKERKAMIAAVKKNDRVLTSGGIIGVVTNAKDHDVTIRIDDDKNVRIRVSRNYITAVLDRGEDSSAREPSA
jgi:preprotein translocase subunit YajC